METPIELFNISEGELTEIIEDESMGLNYVSKTSIDFKEVYRVSKYQYRIGKEDYRGSRIIMYDSEIILVAESYNKVETTRRMVKALIIALNNEKSTK